MHTQAYADKVKMRYVFLYNPAPIEAAEAWGELTDIVGEDEADRWFDAAITDSDGWPVIAQKIRAKLFELGKEVVRV